MKKITLFLIIVFAFAFSSISFATYEEYTDLTDDYEQYYWAIDRVADVRAFDFPISNIFDPTGPITRAQNAKYMVMLSDLLEELPDEVTTMPYPDVPTNHWAAQYISVSQDYGLMYTYNDGTFKPEKNITYSEALYSAIIVLGYDESNLDYPVDYMLKAVELELTDGMKNGIKASDPMTKVDYVQLLYNMLITPLEGGTKTLEQYVFGTDSRIKVPDDYTDLTGENEKYMEAMQKVDSLKLFDFPMAYEFGVNEPISRAQAAKSFVLTANEGDYLLELNELDDDIYEDVSKEHKFARYIDLAKKTNMIYDYGDNNFYPDNDITYAEALYTAVRILGYGDDNYTYPTDYMLKAVELELTDGMNAPAVANNPITRADFVQLLCNILATPIQNNFDIYENIIFKTQFGEMMDLDYIDEEIIISYSHYNTWYDVGKYEDYLNCLIEYRLLFKDDLYLVDVVDSFSTKNIDQCDIVDTVNDDEEIVFRSEKTLRLSSINLNKRAIYVMIDKDDNNKMFYYNWIIYDTFEELLEVEEVKKNDRIINNHFNKTIIVITSFLDNDITVDGYLINSSKTIIRDLGINGDFRQYNGEIITPQIKYLDESTDKMVNIDPEIIDCSGDLSATEIGNYEIVCSLKDKDNYCWDDVDPDTGEFSTKDKVLEWQIDKGYVNYLYTNSQRVLKTLTGNEVEVKLEDITFGVKSETDAFQSTKDYYEISNNVYDAPGDYEATVTVKDQVHYYTVIGGNGKTSFQVPVTIISGEPGDVNLDNKINIVDVRLLLQKVINSDENTIWSERDMIIMDMDGSKKIDIIDVRLLLQKCINQE